MNLSSSLTNKLGAIKRKHLLAAAVGFSFLSLGIVTFLVLKGGADEGAHSFEKGKIVWIDLADGKVHSSSAVQPVITSQNNDLDPSKKSDEAASEIQIKPPVDGIRLNPAPNEEFIEKTEYGDLPKISTDGTKPWIHYGRSFINSGKTKKIALVITGIGLNKELIEKAIALDVNISLAFSTYTPELNAWMTSSRTYGHEFLLEAPLELNHYPAIDPGPNALMTTIMPEENVERLKKVMGKTSGYVGFIAPKTEVFFAGKEDFIKPIIEELAKRGVFMVFAHNEQRTKLDAKLKESSLPYLHADIKLEYGADEKSIKSALESLESIAMERGHAIGVVEFSPNMQSELNKWSASLKGRGFQLVPISALARLNFS